MKALCVLCRCSAVQKFLGVVVHTLVMKIWVGVMCLIRGCEFGVPNGDGLDSNGVIHTCYA